MHNNRRESKSVHDTTNPEAPPLAPPTPVVASLIVQYERRRCYYGYSDRGMRTILIKKQREDRPPAAHPPPGGRLIPAALLPVSTGRYRSSVIAKSQQLFFI